VPDARADGVFRYYRVYADADGESHRESCDMPMFLREFVPSAPPLSVTSLHTGTGMLFLTIPAGLDADWHPTPQRQWQIFLGDGVEADVSDGTIFTCAAGDVYLLEDTHGRGHRTRNVGEHAVVAAIIPAPEQG
jgi:hypothetical protein